MDVHQEMCDMFENVLKDATTSMSGSDRGRVMLDHSSNVNRFSMTLLPLRLIVF